LNRYIIIHEIEMTLTGWKRTNYV